MDVLQKEIDEVYATQPTAHETLDYGVVEQHQRFIRSLTEINGGCAVISDLSNRKSYVTVHPWAHFLGLTPEEAALSVIDSMDEDCIYQYIDNLVQIMENTPSGNVWLIFCLYSLSADQRPEQGIYATITQMESGEVETLFLSEEHRNILSEREKEILRCIRKGLSSKEIAATFYISVNTVNRHRQNILEKLSVGNSIEACRAAELMKLL